MFVIKTEVEWAILNSDMKHWDRLKWQNSFTKVFRGRKMPEEIRISIFAFG